MINIDSEESIPLKVGSMLFTLVDPKPGYEVAYNRWYERDHFYGGCMTGPYCFAGGRWVATRELKNLRFPVNEKNLIAEPWDSGSYLATYWIEGGHHDDHFAWGAKQVQKLYADGRGFNERKHSHTALYNHVKNYYRDSDPVPMELALDHGYKALVTVFIEKNEGAENDEFKKWLEIEGLQSVFDSGHVDSCSLWQPVPMQEEMTGKAPMDLGTSSGGKSRIMQLFFLQEDPKKVWGYFMEYSKRLESSNLGTVVFAAPFLKTLVGTDKYSDQLW